MRKVRSDAVLENLPAEQKEQLDKWLLDECLSLQQVKDRLEKEFSVIVGRDAVHRYNQALMGIDALEQLRESAALAKELPQGWYEEAERIQSAAEYLLLCRIQQRLLLNDCTTNEVIAMGKMLIRFTELELKRNQLREEMKSAVSNPAVVAARRNVGSATSAPKPESRPVENVALNGAIHQALVAGKSPTTKMEKSVNDLVDKILTGKKV